MSSARTISRRSSPCGCGPGNLKDTYQTLGDPNVYAVGIAAAVNAPWQTANAVGVPKTGFPAETTAHVVATNIASQIRGEEPTKEEGFGDIPAVCIMDAGTTLSRSWPTRCSHRASTA